MPNWQNDNQQNDTWQSQTGQNASQENNTQHCDTWHNGTQLNDTEHNIHLMLIMLSVENSEFCHTECHNAEYCYADCRYARCLGVLFYFIFQSIHSGRPSNWRHICFRYRRESGAVTFRQRVVTSKRHFATALPCASDISLYSHFMSSSLAF